jgi:Ca2+-binding RTX toxin-like protein
MTWRSKLVSVAAVAGLAAACADQGASRDGVLGPAFSLDAAAPTCEGRAATIYRDAGGDWVKPAGASVRTLANGMIRIDGTSGDDVIVGTPGADVIVPGLGNDFVCAGDGDDIIEDAGGHDRLYGGAGNDRIAAGPGSDRVEGGDGADIINGGGGVDELFGGDGDDQLFGDRPNVLASSRDFANGGNGTDVCTASVNVNCEM